MKPPILIDEKDLLKRLERSQGSEDYISTTLHTDERVIARVTDGIYRQPGSALRELISNAYDADATKVSIKTDYPRFSKITIEDDGHGMSPKTLTHLLFHIGGSAKRSDSGKDLGVTSPTDPFSSPKGRKLIGKIGIGLFSVSQLTQSFQIITKEKGDFFRTVATISLKQYSEDQVAEANGNFESGKVNVWKEPASDKEAHGTTIILTSIRPQARDTLQSRDIWAAIEQSELAGEDDTERLDPPRYHIGRLNSGGTDYVSSDVDLYRLPWEVGDPPKKAFKKLVRSVWQEIGKSSPNPQIDRIFDNYLRMVWHLALSVPMGYVEEDLADLPVSKFGGVYSLSNSPKGVAAPFPPSKKSLKEVTGFKATNAPNEQFDVFFDDLKLARPIVFDDLPATENALKKPLVFIGKYKEDFAGIHKEFSGGTLSFVAYLFWFPKIAPVEHQGSLIRINGSSGTLFDPTFMRYQISEQTRLRQITCEIFVEMGLDSALNIDRESFNTAHPHAVLITKWLHGALRQVVSVQKRIAAQALIVAREGKTQSSKSEIQQIAATVWHKEMQDEASEPPPINLLHNDSLPSTNLGYSFFRSSILPESIRAATKKQAAKNAILEEKLKSIAQILASFGLLDSLSKRKQENLLQALYKVLETPQE